MKAGLTTGQTYEKAWTTTPEMGIRHLGPRVRPVLSTPAMIGLMEATSVEFLSPYMESGEQTVGFHVDVKHLAPTPIGQTVTFKMTVREVRDRRFTLGVEASNEQGGKIGEGTHRRALINIAQFTQDD